MTPKLANLEPYVLSIVRIVVSFIFAMHGLMIYHWISAPQIAGMGAGHAGGPSSVAALTGMQILTGGLEVFGGGLVVLGLFTRPVAFLLSGEMAVAYFMVHAPMSFWPLFNNGDAAVLYCFIFFLFVFTGGGIWSLDAVLQCRFGVGTAKRN